MDQVSNRQQRHPTNHEGHSRRHDTKQILTWMEDQVRPQETSGIPSHGDTTQTRQQVAKCVNNTTVCGKNAQTMQQQGAKM